MPSSSENELRVADTLRRLSTEARALLIAMVTAHLASSPEQREFMLLRTMGGSDLLFTGDAPFEQSSIDEAALADLQELGLLRKIRQTSTGPVFDVGLIGREVYAALMRERGSEVAVIEETARRSFESGVLSNRHSATAHHLGEAFTLLWSGSTTTQTVSEIGAHLRGALGDLVSDLTDPTTNPELVEAALRGWLEGRAEKRTGEVVLDLAKSTMKLVQRLVHIRDETSAGRPLDSWAELRRACFLTAVFCFEIAELAEGR